MKEKKCGTPRMEHMGKKSELTAGAGGGRRPCAEMMPISVRFRETVEKKTAAVRRIRL